MTHATDSAGDLVTHQLYHPYGQDAGTYGVPTFEGYAGTRRDPLAELGLIRIGARYYAPSLGRWTTPDRYIGESPERMRDLPLEANLFSYARNNPITYKDPTGRQAGQAARAAAQVFQAGAAGEVGLMGGLRVLSGLRPQAHGSSDVTVIAVGSDLGPIGQYASDATATRVVAAEILLTGRVLAYAIAKTASLRGRFRGEIRYVFATYTVNTVFGVYTGRTSAIVISQSSITDQEAAQRAVDARWAGHHMAESALPGASATLDRYRAGRLSGRMSQEQREDLIFDYAAIRGQEQLRMSWFGGSRRLGGTAGNWLNGVSPAHVAEAMFIQAAVIAFPTNDRRLGGVPNSELRARNGGRSPLRWGR